MDFTTFWQYDPQEVMAQLQTTAAGLSSAEATKRLLARSKKKKERPQLIKDIILFISQFKSPLVLLLVAAVILAAFLGETSDVFIILFILLSTGILSFLQEKHAGKEVEQLEKIIRSKIKVLRDKKETKVFTEEIAAGDILLFAS